MSERDEDMLTTRETLALLRISRTTLYRLMRDGTLTPMPSSPALKRPQLRFRRADVERLMRQSPPTP